jgi:hypothetical protein
MQPSGWVPLYWEVCTGTDQDVCMIILTFVSY